MQINTPRWAVPLLSPKRYKGGKGGRSSGKSHFFAEMLVEEHVIDKDLQSVCIREIQKSLKFSAKKLVESKIRDLGVSHLFEITLNEIRRKDGLGIIIFQGMQDHTADSIKSLEGFHRAWVEEAQSMSHRSLELLIPTIRQDGSEIWFTWNPDQPTDAVERLMTVSNPDAVTVHVNYQDNPWCPDVMYKEADRQMKVDYERYSHIWLGGHNTKSESQVFNGKWRVDEFEPLPSWDGAYVGLDFGFANDPTAMTVCYVNEGKLYISHSPGMVALELDDTAPYLLNEFEGLAGYVIRADNARPESISYLRRNGLPNITSCEKGKGSVEDGVEFIKSFDEIIIHTRCKEMQEEARLYSYVIDKRSGDIMPKLEDKNNHWWDSVRYALEPLMKANKSSKAVSFFR